MTGRADPAGGIPAEIGPYRLEGLLGEGGMGRVYLGRTPAGSAVAVKVVHRAYAADPEFRKRFALEVAAARRVQGLYTVPVVAADLDAGEPWLATAYAPGPSLQQAVGERGPLPADEVLVLAARIAEALETIHAAGVIHRDLKPSNIVLTADGPKVIDFGIARAVDVTAVTATGMRAGTPAYMAPEYIRGQQVTEAGDVFALGLVAHFAATGRLAFGGGSDHGVAYRIIEAAPDLDGCPESVRRVVARCLEKAPARRPTPAEVVRLCGGAEAGGTGDGRTPTVVSAPPVTGPDAPTATAPARTPAPDAGPVTPSPPPYVALLGVVGVIALAAVLVAVLLPSSKKPPKSKQPYPVVAATAIFAKGTSGIAFSRDGRTLATGGEQGKVRLWDVATRKVRTTLIEKDWAGKPLRVLNVVFSADGKTLATRTYSHVVGVWDVAGRREIRRIEEYAYSIALSPDGKRITLGSSVGAGLWDVNSRSEDPRAHFTQEVRVTDVAFSPDGKTLASVGDASDNRSSPNNEPAKLWDLTRIDPEPYGQGDPRRNLALEDVTYAVAFSPDGKTLATGGPGGDVRLWDVATGRLKATLANRRIEARDLAFSPDGRSLAVTADGGVLLWNLADRRPSAILADDDTGYGDDEIRELAFSPDGRLLAGSTLGGVDEPDEGSDSPDQYGAPDDREANNGVRLWEVPSGSAPSASP
ncbi:WD40 repeat domain-containing serine/threonine protein kinase [Streptomyces sp. ARC12]|uniref:WD40 repeat domain-containing serine/threonine protein kinase n=1 Tax=Streptomyces sp. ARC12 TaxID=2724151 RepID=UPI003857A71D